MKNINRINGSLFKIYLVIFIISFSVASWSFLLPVYLQQLGGSYFDVGLLGMASGIPYIVLPFIAGTLSDKFGRRLFFCLGLFIMAITAGLFVLTEKVFEVILIRVLSGVAYALMWPISIAMVSDLSRVEERVKALGYYSFSFALGLLLGPFFGGIIVEKSSFTLLFVSSMVLGLLSFLLALLGFRERRMFKTAVVEQPTWINQWSSLIPIFLIVLVSSMVLSMAFNVFPAYLNNLGLYPSEIGLLFAVFGLVRAVTFMQTGRITSLGDDKSIILGLSCLSIATFSIYNLTGFNHFIAIMLILGFGLGILTPLSASMVSKAVGKERVGSAMGASESIFGVGWSVSPFIGGVMAQSILGPTSPYLLLCILCTVLLAPAALWIRS